MKKTVLKTSLDHLPLRKQDELAILQEIILKHVPVEMIILFGSYARGDYVEQDYTQEHGATYGYISDFDILVVTKREIESTNRRWREIRAAIARRPLLTRTAIINHDISFLNEKIKYNYYFFVDLVKEGIMLYDSGDYELSTPQKLTPKKRLEKAQQYFEYWFNKANSFFDVYKFCLEKGEYNIAAFSLHQAAENYYTAFSLVLTDYKPKTHDLEELCDRAIKIHEAHRKVFPRQTEEEERLFELLRKAYVDARYKRDYKITPEELEYLSERVVLLRELTEQLSRSDLERLKGLVG